MNERSNKVLKTSGGPQSAAVRTGVLQRKCDCGTHTIAGGECSGCSKQRETGLRRSAITGDSVDARDNAAPPIVHDVLSSSGRPLDAATRAFMEPRFGRDFSRVRIHTDAKAAESAQAVNALAYTVGSDIVFSSRQYAPATTTGKKLLAHELTHVAQQSSGKAQGSRAALTVGSREDAHEREADAVAVRVTSGERVNSALLDGDPNRISLQQASPRGSEANDGRPGCAVRPGIANSSCSAYLSNAYWLPLAYVNNATCACTETPNVPTAKCVRKFLQDRLAATPTWIKVWATSQKLNEITDYPVYQAFVQTVLTPRIYQDHEDAYATCCCPSGPAPYPAWIGVTSVPLPCPAVGAAIKHFGSCHGTPGSW
jgi:hypothetical protein